jgi:mannose-6-phosphate isomerase
LYDYGRPRELHLEHGVKVSDLSPYHYDVKARALGPGRIELAVSEYFRIEKLTIAEPVGVGSAPYYMLLNCLKGSGTIAGEYFNAGTAWLVPALAESFKIDGNNSEWIVSYTAPTPASNLAV